MILQLMYKECKKRENKTNKKTEGKPEQEWTSLTTEDRMRTQVKSYLSWGNFLQLSILR
jgi:hypothetical protein